MASSETYNITLWWVVTFSLLLCAILVALLCSANCEGLCNINARDGRDFTVVNWLVRGLIRGSLKPLGVVARESTLGFGLGIFEIRQNLRLVRRSVLLAFISSVNCLPSGLSAFNLLLIILLRII